jgi:ankyrin repeat protein
MQGNRELMDACWLGRYEEAKAIIAKNPQLVYTACDRDGRAPAHRIVSRGNVDFLQHMLDAILLLSLQQQQQQQQQQEEKEKEQQMLRDAFEKASNNGQTPAHCAAMLGRVHCLVFLAEHAPSRNEPQSFSSSGLEIPDRSSSGAAVLEVKNCHGVTPLHLAAAFGGVDALDFIVRNAPSGGVQVLEDRLLVIATTATEQQGVKYINNIGNRVLPASSTSNIQGCTGLCGYP